MTNRSNTADFAKGIAVILMIQVHVMQLFALPDIFQSTIGKISLFLGGPPVAPVFLAIMGYYLIASKKTTAQNLVRGVKLLLFGILLNISLNVHLLYKILTGEYQLNPLEYIFGIDIFFCAGLSIIFIASIKKYLAEHIWITPIIIALITILSEIINPLLTTTSFLKYIAAFFGGDYKWSYFPIFPWLSYSLAGVLFYQIRKKIKITQNQVLIILFIGIIPLFATFSWASTITHQLKLYYHHNLIFFLWTSLFLVVWIVFSDISERAIAPYFKNNFIITLGRNVTSAYAFQWIIIGNVATAVYKSLPFLQALLSVFFIILLTLVFVFLKERFFKKHSL